MAGRRQVAVTIPTHHVAEKRTLHQPACIESVMYFDGELLSWRMTENHYSASIVWSDADHAYVATCPEFPGLSAVEPDMMLALAVLHDAVVVTVGFKEDGLELPEPLRLGRSHPDS